MTIGGGREVQCLPDGRGLIRICPSSPWESKSLKAEETYKSEFVGMCGDIGGPECLTEGRNDILWKASSQTVINESKRTGLS